MIEQDNKVFFEHTLSGGRTYYSLYKKDGEYYRGKNITYLRCKICNRIVADVWGCFDRHLKTHKIGNQQKQ